MKQQFIEAFNALASEVHETARAKGWWDNADADRLREIANDNGGKMRLEDANALRDLANSLERRNDGEMLALVHSEVSEILEGLRHGNLPDDKIPKFSAAEAESADVIIRIMDMAAARGWRVGEALVAKMEMNRGREHRHGGKKF